MSSARWIEIGDCAIIKTEDLIQLEEKPRHAKKANRCRWVNRGGKGGRRSLYISISFNFEKEGGGQKQYFRFNSLGKTNISLPLKLICVVPCLVCSTCYLEGFSIIESNSRLSRTAGPLWVHKICRVNLRDYSWWVFLLPPSSPSVITPQECLIVPNKAPCITRESFTCKKQRA